MIGITLAFLAKDQIDCGVRRGEQTIILALFGLSLAMLVGLGSPPLGPAMVIALLGVALRRALRDDSGSRHPLVIPTPSLVFKLVQKLHPGAALIVFPAKAGSMVCQAWH